MGRMNVVLHQVVIITGGLPVSTIG
jgi:hypothetical protein